MTKALASGADEVVIDLEDAVAPAEKAVAREQLAGFSWPEDRPSVVVRVNAIGSPWCHRDLEVVAALPQVGGVVVPKVESRADLAFVERLLDGLESEVGRHERVAVQALVETAAGIADLREIVSGPRRLAAVIVGYADLAASLGRSRTIGQGAWRGVQDAIIVHARAAGVDAIDGPFLGTAVDDAFLGVVADAAALGFDSKWVIHPRQVDAVNAGFTPSEAAIAHARQVMETLDGAHGAGAGAIALDGALVDEAMARDARRVLAKAGDR